MSSVLLISIGFPIAPSITLVKVTNSTLEILGKNFGVQIAAADYIAIGNTGIDLVAGIHICIYLSVIIHYQLFLFALSSKNL